jgi:hypothetical protein
MFKKNYSFGFNLREDYRFPFFLMCMTSFLFIPSFVGKGYHDLVSNVLFVGFILSSLTLIRTESRWQKVFTYFVGVIGIVAEIINNLVFQLSYTWQVLFNLILFIYFTTLLIELLGQIFNSKVITLNVVLGAFTGYLMIGILGFLVFRFIYMADPSSFDISSSSSQDLLYYTFITLTTIGYGDISPISDAARNFSIILGLIGQFYNTIIIAIIIGKFLQR